MLLLLEGAQITYAIEVLDPTRGSGLLPSGSENPSGILANIISYGIGIAGILAVLAVTWASIQMVLAAWDEEKVKKAWYMMIYAFIGVVIAGLAYAIVKFIMNLKLDSFL